MRQQGEAEERDQRHRDPVRDYEPADIERRRRQQQRHVGPKKQVEEKKAGHRQHPRPRLRRQPWSSELPALMAFRLRRYSRLRLAILLKCASASIERSKYDTDRTSKSLNSTPKCV